MTSHQELRVSYTLQELRALLPRKAHGKGCDERTIMRWLRKNDVPVERVGRDNVVWLADLAQAFPQFERSIALARQMQEG